MGKSFRQVILLILVATVLAACGVARVLVPWLPGADYTAALTADGRLGPVPIPTGGPTSPAPTAMPTSPCSPGLEWSPLPLFRRELDSVVDYCSHWERARRSHL